MKRSFIKVDTISFCRLDNAEIMSFMSRFRQLLPVQEENNGDAPDLSISAAQIKMFDNTLLLMQDVSIEPDNKVTTQSRKKVDRYRDALAAAIVDKVIRTRKLPLPAEREAAEELYNQAKMYRGLESKRLNTKTEIIRSLLVDFSKPEYASNISVLGLQKLLDKLKKYNEMYADMVKQDDQEETLVRIAQKPQELRRNLYDIYEEMVAFAFASNVLKPNDSNRDFLDNLNTLIADVKTNYKRRMAAKRKKKKK